MQSSDAQLLRQPNCPKPKRHNAKLCRFTVRQQIVNALANGDSKRAIARGLRVSNNTVTAIAEQEWQQVESRKERIVAQCERNATLAADQLSERLETEKLSANQLVPVFGVSVDKMLALTSQTPSINIVNIPLPSAEERAELNAIDRKLDAIAAKIKAAQAAKLLNE